MKKAISLLILVTILSITLASCGGTCCGSKSFSSYDECKALIEEFQANGGKNLPRFIFNLDNNMISDLKYEAGYLVDYTNIPFKKYSTDYQGGLNFDAEFYLNEVDEDGNIAERAYKFTILSQSSYHGAINDKSVIKIEEDYINTSILSPDKSEQVYNYNSKYYIQIEKTIVYSIEILSIKELTMEKVDEIHKLLMDSISLCE